MHQTAWQEGPNKMHGRGASAPQHRWNTSSECLQEIRITSGRHQAIAVDQTGAFSADSGRQDALRLAPSIPAQSTFVCRESIFVGGACYSHTNRDAPPGSVEIALGLANLLSAARSTHPSSHKASAMDLVDLQALASDPQKSGTDWDSSWLSVSVASHDAPVRPSASTCSCLL